MSDDEDELTVGKESYRRILSIVRANSGSPQHPLLDRTGLGTIFINHMNKGGKTLNKGTRLAVRNGHLIEWQDDGRWTAGEGGRSRVGITLDGLREIDAMTKGGYPFAVDDLETITTVREIELSRESSDSDVIGWAEQHRIEIQERTEGENHV